MARDTRTAAQRNRAIRQEALRDQLSNQKHVEHVVDIIDKLLDADNELDPTQVNRLKIAMEGKFKLINKYLADIKQMDVDVQADVNHNNLPDLSDEDKQHLAEIRRKLDERPQQVH